MRMHKLLIFSCTALFLLLSSASHAQDGCIDPDLINPNVLCPGIYAPVCGCDGVTYSNDCIAVNFAGVTSYTTGECQNIDDITPPELVVPEDTTVECSEEINLESATATDNSGSVTLIETTEEFSGSCPGNYSIVRTFVATDPSGNTTVGSQTIAVQDTTVPDWTTPPSDGVIGCVDPMEAEAFMFNWASSTAGGSASDACSNTLTYGNDFDAIPLIDCSETVVVNVGFYAADECGNQNWSNAELTIIPGSIEVQPCDDVAGINFGECDAILGIARINGYCTEISGCGTMVGPTDYSPAFYGSIEDCVTDCNEGCISQEYLDLGVNIVCSAEVNPVCGCDGNTYTNPCTAMFFGGNVTFTDGPCVVIEEPGCTYPGACNYNPNAAFEDGSCLFPPIHCPFPPSTPGGGCTYADADNFDASAMWDDGTCTYTPCGNDCAEDVNNDGIVSVTDILLLLGQFGLQCE